MTRKNSDDFYDGTNSTVRTLQQNTNRKYTYTPETSVKSGSYNTYITYNNVLSRYIILQQVAGKE